MRLSVNLATRPFADVGPALKQLRVAMGGLALIAIALGFGVHALDNKAEEARARERSVDAQIAQINSERQGYQALMRLPQNAAVLAQAENLNQIFDTKAFSWTLAIEDLETVLPGGVQVTTLEPTRNKDGSITLRLLVLGPRESDVKLVENLEHSKRFLAPRIVGETSEANQGPNQRTTPINASNRVNFDVLADYNPAPPSETKAAKAAPDGNGNAADAPQAFPAGMHRPPYLGPSRPKAPVEHRLGGPPQ